MVIGIDARMYGGEQTGIGNYIRNLINYLLRIDLNNEYILFLLDREYRRYKISSPRIRKVKVNARWYTFSEQIKLPSILKSQHLDLMHFPHFNAPLIYKEKYLLTIHDLTQNYFPGHGLSAYLRKKVYRYVFAHNLNQAKKIISVSQYTKKDILNNFVIDPQKIEVIYEGVDATFRPQKEEKNVFALDQKYSLQKPFILFVGVLRDHKNIVGLIKAFYLILDKYKWDGQLVITGKPNPRYPELSGTIKKLGLKKRIIFPGFVSKSELTTFYKAAEMLVLPSFREGFGFPPLEAMASGTPVAASAVTSIPEVVGDAALLFNPYNPADMARKIMQLLSDPNLRDELIKKGLQRVKRFTWQNCAQNTFNLYRKVLD